MTYVDGSVVVFVRVVERRKIVDGSVDGSDVLSPLLDMRVHVMDFGPWWCGLDLRSRNINPLTIVDVEVGLEPTNLERTRRELLGGLAGRPDVVGNRFF